MIEALNRCKIKNRFAPIKYNAAGEIAKKLVGAHQLFSVQHSVMREDFATESQRTQRILEMNFLCALCASVAEIYFGAGR